MRIKCGKLCIEGTSETEIQSRQIESSRVGNKNTNKNFYLEVFLANQKKAGCLELFNNNFSVRIKSTGWASVMVGRPFPSRGKRVFKFICDSDSEGLMISIANRFDFFVNRYPGSGSHGLTIKEDINRSPDKVPGDPYFLSITFYKPRKKGDLVIMKANFEKWKVTFVVQNAKNEQLWKGSEQIAPKYRTYNSWTALVSLCSVGEVLSVLRH